MSNEDIKNDIAKTMLSAAHELSLYINDANEGLRKKVHSQTETEPDWHDTQTCYELAQDSKRVEAMALRIKELEAALDKIKDITGELGGQNPANFCEELAMEQDDATYRVYKLSNIALSKALEQT